MEIKPTRAEILAKARAARNPDRLRELARVAGKQPKRNPLPCNCGAGEEGKHKATCRVYRREQARRRQGR